MDNMVPIGYKDFVRFRWRINLYVAFNVLIDIFRDQKILKLYFLQQFNIFIVPVAIIIAENQIVDMVLFYQICK